MSTPPRSSRHGGKRQGGARRTLIILASALLAAAVGIGAWIALQPQAGTAGGPDTGSGGPSSPGGKGGGNDGAAARQEKEREQEKAFIEQTLSGMSLDERISQMLMVDLEAVEREAGSVQLEEAVRQLRPGGIILFRPDMPDISTVLALNRRLQQTAAIPLWISTDQEGGIVTRLPFASPLNGNMAIGATGRAEAAAETGSTLGEMLAKLDINLDFAPVADINSNPDNPVIGLRSFGSDPEQVADFVTSFIGGMHSAGLPAVAKHFPGHGDTATDSHIGLPKLDYGLSRFESVEWVPFRAAIAGGVDAIMSAHIQVPQLEPAAAVSKLDGKPITLPATLSPRILTGVLREQLGFQGVIVTDALNMKAIADHFGSEEAAVMAVKAGADMLLMPPDPAAAVDAIHRAVDAGELEPARIDDSVRRILRMKRKYGLLPDTASPPGALEDAIQEAEAYFQAGSAEETADRIASEAATVWGTAVKKNLPLLRGDGRRIILIGDNRTVLERVQREIEAAASSMSGGSIRVDARAPADAPSPRQWPDGAIAVWVAQDLHHDRDSAEKASSWFQAAGEHGIAAAVLSVGTPYDMTELPDIPLGIAVYGTTPSNLRAGVQALFSAEPPAGKLPVALP
ncbi:beta-glucosidase [Paenibacillus dendritiformis]|uniref:glycoside hydrolase family 3 protein n=2 Tax=Paenibacillus dendritiformis TaxID=130049 RepID=UPI00143D1B1D|nr:glycoside hydrolase family 3 N-terminal domain-containing protein [Paenibacillus dendritiformis]NKI23211.1 beta-glucosidase [Paenibacillus dendritiformis]